MKDFLSFKEAKNDIVDGMLDLLSYFEEDEDKPYTNKQVKTCGDILDNYIESLIENTKGIPEDDKERLNDAILSCVQNTIEQLNELNELCDEALIETDQREDLCSFIDDAAKIAGLVTNDEDITEQWREW